VRTLILINEGSLNISKTYSTEADFVNVMKLDIEEALVNIYDV
jgi:hypothetical protein